MHIILLLFFLGLLAGLMVDGHLARSQARWEELNADHDHETQAQESEAQSHQLAA